MSSRRVHRLLTSASSGSSRPDEEAAGELLQVSAPAGVEVGQRLIDGDGFAGSGAAVGTVSDVGALQRADLDHLDGGMMAVAHVLHPSGSSSSGRPISSSTSALDVLPAWLSELQDPAPQDQPRLRVLPVEGDQVEGLALGAWLRRRRGLLRAGSAR